MEQEPHIPPEPGNSYNSEWEYPPPPEFETRAWLIMTLERFGFWIACAVTVAVIAFLYINADFITQTDRVPRPVEAENQSAPVQPNPAEAVSVPAEVPDTTAAGVPTSITTDPAGAAIFIDGTYVGTSPLRALALTDGRHLLSLLKPNYAQLDTVVMISPASASLQLTLREAGDVVLAEATEDLSPETPGEPDETDPAASSSSPTEVAQIPEDQTTSPPETGQTNTEETPPAAVETSSDATEDPVVDEEPEELTSAVGTIQVNSEPSGASVLMADRAVGVTPVLLTDIPAGTQPITLRLDGYDDFSTTVEVVAQQQSAVNGQLQQRLGTLKILVKPWGTIYINGELHKEESTVWYTTQLPPGNHTVRAVHPALGNFEQVVVVPAGREQAVTIDLNKNDSGSQ